MSDIDDYLCKEGYLCHRSMTISKPDSPVTDGTTGDTLGEICPVGYHCPIYLSHKLECADGFVSEETGLAFCETCPTGYYCDNVESITKTKIACITDSVCDLGEKR